MPKYTVYVQRPSLLEDDASRMITIDAINLTKLFEVIEAEIAEDEYIHHVTVRASEEEPAMEVWHYLEGVSGYTSHN